MNNLFREENIFNALTHNPELPIREIFKKVCGGPISGTEIRKILKRLYIFGFIDEYRYDVLIRQLETTGEPTVPYGVYTKGTYNRPLK